MYAIVKEVKSYRGLITTAQYAILARLADYADKEGEACPSARTLAKQTGYTERTAFRALALFRKLGIIETLDEHPEKFRKYKSVTRRFNMPDAWFEPATPARQQRSSAEISAAKQPVTLLVKKEESTSANEMSYKSLVVITDRVKTTEEAHYVRFFCEEGDKMAQNNQEVETNDPARDLWRDDEPTLVATPRRRPGRGWDAVRVAVAESSRRVQTTPKGSPVSRLVAKFVELSNVYEQGPTEINGGALGRTFKRWMNEFNMTFEDISEMIRIYWEGGKRRKGIAWKDFLDQRMDLWKHYQGNLARAAEPVYDDMNDDDGSVLIDWASYRD